MKLFSSRTGCLVYERASCADETEGGGRGYPAAIYRYRDNYVLPPKLRRLLEVARGRVRSWRVVLQKVKKRWILFAHAPFASKIPVPPEAKRVSIACGFTPGFYRHGIAHSDGVELRLSGIGGDGETLLQRFVFDPARDKSLPRGGKIVRAEFPAGTFSHVLFEIRPRRNNACDWTYVGSLSFR